MLNFLNKYKQKSVLIKLSIRNHLTKNYVYYIYTFQFFSLLFACYYYYKYFGQPFVIHNAGSSPLTNNTNNPVTSLVELLESGEIPRIPLPCTHYTELNPGLYEVTEGAYVEIFKKDNASPTRLVGIHIPDMAFYEGEKSTRTLGARQVGCALFELRDKGVSTLTSSNTKNTPEVLEYLKSHAVLGGLRPSRNVRLTNKLMNELTDLEIAG